MQECDGGPHGACSVPKLGVTVNVDGARSCGTGGHGLGPRVLRAPSPVRGIGVADTQKHTGTVTYLWQMKAMCYGHIPPSE